MDKFKTGDLCRVIHALSPDKIKRIGTVVQIAGPSKPCSSHALRRSWFGYSVVGSIEYCPEEAFLELIPPKEETTTWSECEWVPDNIKVPANF